MGVLGRGAHPHHLWSGRLTQSGSFELGTAEAPRVCSERLWIFLPFRGKSKERKLPGVMRQLCRVSLTAHVEPAGLYPNQPPSTKGPFSCKKLPDSLIAP